jgi:hypothetical protein
MGDIHLNRLKDFFSAANESETCLRRSAKYEDSREKTTNDFREASEAKGNKTPIDMVPWRRPWSLRFRPF